tara:strand:- start:1590 stop:2303 length:714 start_codon:yes stop_codon:yes gene_type:complete
MSIITTYPTISTVAQDDLLIISDVSLETTPTRSVTVQQLVGGSTAPLSLTTTGTSGAATLISNVLNIPQYSDGITTVSTNGDTGEAAIVGTNINIPNYNINQLAFGFEIKALGNPAINIGRNTFTPTSGSGGINWIIAADGGTVGSFTITASDDVFDTTSSGNYLTHFSIMDPNLTTPSAGTGTLPRMAIARVTSTNTFNLSFFEGQTGTVLGERVEPANGDLDVTVLVTRYLVSSP